ncbi:hypothetical protein MKW94_007128 [Papaver nudicaule]|uniref:Plastocyanin-like domain-containing protein n=1 Tax=Papaver nudicaule TaxID=74823 RepID=A0AA41SIY3_PAPNU|nr:hypothetical protein [Papaver nudicaule]
MPCPQRFKKSRCQGPNGTRFTASMNNHSFVLPSSWSLLQAQQQGIPGTADNHPIHLHGYDFFILAEGFGNFDASKDTSKFNLVDPPLRNTVGVPVGGWAVIRFVADNPGKLLNPKLVLRAGMSNLFLT